MAEHAGLPRRPLKVSLVQPFGEVGGAEHWLLRLLDATDELEVAALLLRDGPVRPLLAERGIDVSVVDVGRRGRDLAQAWGSVRHVLRRHQPHVVLANGVKAQAALGPVPALTGTPSVWVKHDHSFDRWLTPLLARAATQVVATTPELVPATRRSDVTVIRPPRPDLDPLPADEARRRLLEMTGSTASRVLVMLSRLTPYKGIDTAVRALSQPGAAGWHLLVMGGEDPSEPGERERLRIVADQAGVADRVHLVGHVPEAPRLLSGADALAVLTRAQGPRTPGREGFGMAAMEATIAGTPVVAPDDGGPVAVRVARGGGLLVDPTSTASVADALEQLTPARVAQLRHEALALAPELFDDAHTAAARLVAVLDAAVLPRRRLRAPSSGRAAS